MQSTRTFRHVRDVSVPFPHVRQEKRKSTAYPYVRIASRLARCLHTQILSYAALFYILPALLPAAAETALLVLFFPAACFMLSGMHGLKYGFISHYLALPALMFFPSSLIFFGRFSFLYIPCYILVSIIALTVGAIVKQVLK